MDDLHSRLKAWGHATVARHAHQHDGPSSGDTILSKQVDLAPSKTRGKAMHAAERILLGRSGIARRLRMASAANGDGGGVGMAIAPMWSCDPIPAKNDASPPREIPKGWVDIGLPDECLPIDSAIRALARQFPLRAAIIREEYAGTGTQRMKCGRVQAAYGGKLTLRQYRAELGRARDWLAGRSGISR